MKLDSKARAKLAVSMINQGHILEEIRIACGLESHRTLYRDLSAHYEKSGGNKSWRYRNLLKRQRENAKGKKPGNNDVHIIETGYILRAGIEGIKALLKESENVIIPLFCEKELTKMAVDDETARNYLTSEETRSVVCIMDSCWNLDVEPCETLTPRVRGIVALATSLASAGFKVYIHTNSNFIEHVAIMQNRDIEVKVLLKT